MPWVLVTSSSDGVTASYTLPSIPVDPLLVVDRTPQLPSDVTWAGAQFTFGTIPPVGSSIWLFSNAFTSSTTSAVAGAALDYSTTNILQSIRDVANVGSSQQDWPDSRLLRTLNRSVLEYLLPFIYRFRQGHFDTFADQALVAGQAAYRLNSRATALTIRAVQLVDSNGNPYSTLVEDDLERVINYNSSAVVAASPQGTPQRYYWRGNQMVLFPTPNSATLTLRVYFEARPSALVLNSAAQQIATFPGGGAAGFFRLGYTGALPSGYGAGVAVDLVQNVPGFDVLLSTTINAVSVGNYVELVGTLPQGLAIGDWISLSGTAPVVTGAVPEVVLGCLVDYVALKAFGGKADSELFSRLKAMLTEDERNATEFFKRRNRGDHPVVGRFSVYKFRRGGIGFW